MRSPVATTRPPRRRPLLREGSDVALRAVEDVSAPTARAAKGGLLTGHELLAIADMLDVQARARSKVLSLGGSAPILAAIASGISDLSGLRGRITGSIGQMGEVLDGASPGLGLLRRRARQAYDGAAGALARVVESPEGGEALQDSVVSIRSDRLVVQVKASHRHRVPGVVHGASNTGGDAVRRALRHRRDGEPLARAGTGGGAGDGARPVGALGCRGRSGGGDRVGRGGRDPAGLHHGARQIRGPAASRRPWTWTPATPSAWSRRVIPCLAARPCPSTFTWAPDGPAW